MEKRRKYLYVASFSVRYLEKSKIKKNKWPRFPLHRHVNLLSNLPTHVTLRATLFWPPLDVKWQLQSHEMTSHNQQQWHECHYLHTVNTNCARSSCPTPFSLQSHEIRRAMPLICSRNCPTTTFYRTYVLEKKGAARVIVGLPPQPL